MAISRTAATERTFSSTAMGTSPPDAFSGTTSRARTDDQGMTSGRPPRGDDQPRGASERSDRPGNRPSTNKPERGRRLMARQSGVLVKTRTRHTTVSLLRWNSRCFTVDAYLIRESSSQPKQSQRCSPGRRSQAPPKRNCLPLVRDPSISVCSSAWCCHSAWLPEPC